jgi:Na+-driven multidrug efflux pump
MIMGVTMTILNVVFNIALIPFFGVRGSAMGTCLAAGLVSAFALWRLWSDKWVVSIHTSLGYAPDLKVIKKLFQLGLPAGIQAIAMNIGGVLMLSFVGSLAASAAAQAAYAVGYTQLFSLVSFGSAGLMGAAAAIVGQNLGAKKPDRARAAVGLAARYAFIGSSLLGLLFFFFGRQLLSVFGMRDPEVIEIGVELLRYLSISGIFVSVALTYTGGLQGSGDTKSPLYISVISQVIVPLGICFVLKQTYGLEPWHIWLAIVCGHFTRCILSIFRFNQGKWRQIKVDLESTVG